MQILYVITTLRKGGMVFTDELTHGYFDDLEHAKQVIKEAVMTKQDSAIEFEYVGETMFLPTYEGYDQLGQRWVITATRKNFLPGQTSSWNLDD